MKVQDIDNTYPPLPEKCLELPKTIDSNSGAVIRASFTIDYKSGELAYIQYEHWGYSDRATNEWYWINPDIDAIPIVEKAEQEYGKFSLEAAKAYELLYTQERIFRDSIGSQMTSNRIAYIYSRLYGDTSNEPDLIRAYQREYDSITRDSYSYYGTTLNILTKMLKVKELHPEVNFPDIEELRKRIEEIKPLAKE